MYGDLVCLIQLSTATDSLSHCHNQNLHVFFAQKQYLNHWYSQYIDAFIEGGDIADACIFVWWKHGDTAVANCAPTSLFYAQTNAIYRFYTYQLVIDDAPTIVDGQYWPLQNLTSTNLSMGSSWRGTFLGQKKVWVSDWLFRGNRSGPLCSWVLLYLYLTTTRTHT